MQVALGQHMAEQKAVFEFADFAVGSPPDTVRLQGEDAPVAPCVGFRQRPRQSRAAPVPGHGGEPDGRASRGVCLAARFRRGCGLRRREDKRRREDNRRAAHNSFHPVAQPVPHEASVAAAFLDQPQFPMDG